MFKKIKKGFLIILAITFLLISSQNYSINVFASPPEVSIIELYTDKAAYTPGGTAEISTTLQNNTEQNLQQLVTYTIYHLEDIVYQTTENIQVPAQGIATDTLTWNYPNIDFKGYLVEARLGNNEVKTTAIDVSSDFTRYPRYGYSVDFDVGETTTESRELVEELARDYHISAVQYYDWMWRHEKAVPNVGNTWEDMFGNIISKDSILQRINSGHDFNIHAMAYQMAYMAREGYENYGVAKEWGLYRGEGRNISYDPQDPSTILNIDQLNFPLEGIPPVLLNVFNPQNSSWQDFMIGQYIDAIDELGFDGIHVDQMGSFWGDIDYFDYYGNNVDLGNTFSSFINRAKTLLTANDPTKNYITMNIVNGSIPEKDPFSTWDIAMNANTDFAFSELWENANTYNDVKNFIDWQRTQNDGKAMALAAYMNQYDNCGLAYQAENGSLNGVHSGFGSGLTFVTGFDQAGDSVTLNVNAPYDGAYSLVFHYANGAQQRATKNIYVDGILQQLANFDCTRPGLIPTSPSWDNYSYEAAFTQPKTLYLAAGNHSIRIQHDANNVGDIRLDNLTLGMFDDNSVRLTNATIAASGAMHIEMGTGLSMANGDSSYSQSVMLGHPYYPKAFKSMSNDLREAMKAHYNFITAYENLLYDPDVLPSDGGLQNISIAGQNVTGSGESGKIWFIPKSKGDEYGILHLINLTSENDTVWRNPTNEPVLKNNLTIKYYIPSYKTISAVYLASPDNNNGLTSSLTFSVGTDSTGKYLQFTVPSLKYWNMIYFEWGSEQQPDIIEAEDSILSGVSFNTNHPGYTGRGFVDGYGDLYDSVTFDVFVPASDVYTLKFRYGNDTNNECSRELFINNSSAGKIYFPDGPNWDTWLDSERGVELKSGRNRIVLLVTNQNGGFINLDYLAVQTLEESSRSLCMNNRLNTSYVWKDTEANGLPLLSDGPSIYEMRLYNNQNQIRNYSMFFRDETDNNVYTEGEKFRSVGYLDRNGILISNYKTYNNLPLSPSISRSYAVLPDEKFMLVKYSVTNTSNTIKTYSILDMLHVNNVNMGVNHTAVYDATSKTIKYDMSASGQYYIAHGSLESSINGYQVANDTDANQGSMTCSPWVTFNASGSLKNNTSVSAADISSGFVKEITLQAGQSQDVYFYTAICQSVQELNNTITRVHSYSPTQWLDIMSETW